MFIMLVVIHHNHDNANLVFAGLHSWIIYNKHKTVGYNFDLEFNSIYLVQCTDYRIS